MTPGVHGVAETALFVTDLPRARDFYTRVLGLEALHESEDGCVLAVAPRQVLLLVTARKAAVPSVTSGGEIPACLEGGGPATGAGHLALSIAKAEVSTWRDRLGEHGVEVLSEVAWETGAHSLYFRDPEGHLIELATRGIWGPEW